MINQIIKDTLPKLFCPKRVRNIIKDKCFICNEETYIHFFKHLNYNKLERTITIKCDRHFRQDITFDRNPCYFYPEPKIKKVDFTIMYLNITCRIYYNYDTNYYFNSFSTNGGAGKSIIMDKPNIDLDTITFHKLQKLSLLL